jgi:hypothetical protein
METKADKILTLSGRGFRTYRPMLVVALMTALCSSGKTTASPDWGAASQVCWVRKPYALSRSEGRSGRQRFVITSLIRARESAGDIVQLETVIDDVKRVAVTPRYLVLERGGGWRYKYTVIDLDAEKSAPVDCETSEDLQRFLGERTDSALPPRFQTFEEVYREQEPWWPRRALVCLAAVVFVLGLIGLAVAVFRTTRRYKPTFSPPDLRS